MSKLHRSDLLAELKLPFPQLREEINQSHGLLHLEVAAWTRLTNAAIRECKRELVAESFSVASTFFRNGNRKLQNAIAVSFVEDLDLDNAPWAYDMLSHDLQVVVQQLIDQGVVKPFAHLD